MQRTKCDLKYNKKGIHIYIKQDRKTNKSPTDTQTHMPITLQFNHHENQFSLFVRFFFLLILLSKHTLTHPIRIHIRAQSTLPFPASQPASPEFSHSHSLTRAPSTSLYECTFSRFGFRFCLFSCNFLIEILFDFFSKTFSPYLILILDIFFSNKTNQIKTKLLFYRHLQMLNPK